MRKIINESSKKLMMKHQVPEPENSIRILYKEIFSNPRIKNLPSKVKIFQRRVHMRSYHYPIQYLCRSWPFRELQLVLSKPILIPRFETQYLITLLQDKIRAKYDNFQPSFIQYGCGSGAIGLSLIKELNMKGLMIDIQPKCIALTRANARKNQCKSDSYRILHGDMADHLNKMDQYDTVVSNPPYLSEQHYRKLLKKQVRGFEDKKALVGGEDGLKYIRMLISSWVKRQKPGLLFIEYDGRKFEGDLDWVNQYVELDQYGKNRYIIMEKD